MSDRRIEEKDLRPAELAAVLKHQKELGMKLGREASFDEAVDDFMETARMSWEREKLQKDIEEQKKEVARHKWIESEKAGYDIGEKRAIEDWIRKHAKIWRSERESLRRNGWEILVVKVALDKGLHMRPSSTLASIAGGFDCEVYVHRPGMDIYNFKLEGKAYLNVKSLMGLLTLGAVKGDELEFIATGPQAKEALGAIGEYVRMTTEGPVTGKGSSA